MVGGEHKNWRELANAALEAKDPDKLLEIVQELNKVLKHEEQVRRDFREAAKAKKSSHEILR
jgi:ribosomal protein L16 Arg81 hydroxylase